MPVQKTDADTIVSRALEVFRRRGYHKTSMADLAQACGLLKGSLYHYFPSKEALAVAVMDHVHAHFRNKIFRLAYEDGLPPQERLQRVMQETENYFLDREGGCLMGNIALEAIDAVPDFAGIVQNYFQEWINALAHIFQIKFRPETALQKAEQAVAEVQGAIMMMRVFRNADTFKRVNRRIINDFQNA